MKEENTKEKKSMDRDIWQRLKFLLKAETDSKIAEVLGIRRQSVYDARDKGKIPPGWLIKIAEKTGVSLDWLVFGEGPVYRHERQTPPQTVTFEREEYVFIPLLGSRIVAGPQGEILYETVEDFYPFKRWWVEKLVGRNPENFKHLLLFKVAGDSMAPTINPGEVVLVDTRESERIEIRNGRIYVVRREDGSISLKRVVLSRTEEGLQLVCLSDNTLYNPFTIRIEPDYPIHYYVLGRVRWSGREFN